jgi:hypothetical protein
MIRARNDHLCNSVRTAAYDDPLTAASYVTTTLQPYAVHYLVVYRVALVAVVAVVV